MWTQAKNLNWLSYQKGCFFFPFLFLRQKFMWVNTSSKTGSSIMWCNLQHCSSECCQFDLLGFRIMKTEYSKRVVFCFVLFFKWTFNVFCIYCSPMLSHVTQCNCYCYEYKTILINHSFSLWENKLNEMLLPPEMESS